MATSKPISATKIAARSNFPKTSVAKTEVEKQVVRCFGVLEIAEFSFRPGIDFAEALFRLRDEIKKNGTRNFMQRLKELGITYPKVRYWMAIARGKPINRGRAKHETLEKNAPVLRPTEEHRMDWREDWPAVTTRFREVSSVLILLDQSQPEGRGAFVGELEILAETFGYELKPRKKKGGLSELLQRVPSVDSKVVAGTNGGGAHTAGSGR